MRIIFGIIVLFIAINILNAFTHKEKEEKEPIKWRFNRRKKAYELELKHPKREKERIVIILKEEQKKGE